MLHRQHICLRSACTTTCKAKNANFQAQVLSTFDNGRVEGFLDMRTLRPVEMTEPSMARRIAQRLKHFHSAPVHLEGTEAGRSETFPLIRKW